MQVHDVTCVSHTAVFDKVSHEAPNKANPQRGYEG